MRESALSKKIVTRLRARGAWAFKTHGNRYAQGLPDIVGGYRRVFLALEVKLPGKERTLTDLQRHTIDTINEAEAGIARMVTSVPQVDALLDAIDRRLGDAHR